MKCVIIILLFVATLVSSTTIERVAVQVGCDGVVGSGLIMDRCGECGGEERSCRYIEGIFRSQNLENDYHFVVRIPSGATRINITEMHRTRSCLALRSADPDGDFFINGRLKSGVIDPTQSYLVAGAYFKYTRPFVSHRGENLYAEGPINEDVTVLLYFQGENPGIRYEYVLPQRHLEYNSVSPQSENQEHSRPDTSPIQYEISNLQIGQSDSDLANTLYQMDQSHQWLHRRRERVVHAPLRWTTRGAQENRRVDNPVARNNYIIRNNHPRNMDSFFLRRRDRSNARREAILLNMRSSRNYITASWRIQGYGPCSRSCAGGTRSTIIRCVLIGSHEEVPDVYCSTPKPRTSTKQCNRHACPAYYHAGRWSECSRSCGTGRRTRSVVCRQLYAGNFTSAVSYKNCKGLTKPITQEKCQVEECGHWEVTGKWSECSAKCGSGTQTRRTVCRQIGGGILPNSRCLRMRRPPSIRTCDAGSCVTRWYVTQWEECSANCERGIQHRMVQCLNTANLLGGCPSLLRPNSTRPCARASCGVTHEWFAGVWGKCSSRCGSGVRERRVVCLSIHPNASIDIALPINGQIPCKSVNKPVTQQSCNTKLCTARWHYTPWSECSATCDGGVRSRDVRCLDEDGRYSSLCSQEDQPIETERCNTINCVTAGDSSCQDHLRSCSLVVHAQFCSYTYYRRMCCSSCGASLSVHIRSASIERT